MKLTKTDRYLLAAMGCTHIIPQNPSKETSMTDLTTLNTTPSKETSMTKPQYTWQPLSPAHRSANHYLDTWIQTMQKRGNIQTVYGRIFNTGINYIVRGVALDGTWKEIPCHNLSTAKLYLGMIATEEEYAVAKRLFCRTK